MEPNYNKQTTDLNQAMLQAFGVNGRSEVQSTDDIWDKRGGPPNPFRPIVMGIMPEVSGSDSPYGDMSWLLK